MRSYELGLVVFLIGLSSLVSAAQGTTALNQQYTPPGNIQLLDGYTWTPGIGKDAKVGKISDKSGFSINFDRSAVAGFHAGQFSRKDYISWLKHQDVNGQQLDVALFKNGEIVASFDNTTNFTAKPESSGQLADVLLMVMTYGSQPAYTPPAHAGQIPGNMLLLPGYVNKTEQGVDTWVGTISREGDLNFRYDIGSFAGNYALGSLRDKDEKMNVIWFRNQKVSGLKLVVTYLNDGSLEATFRETCANFMARNVKTDGSIADFLLMIMTYNEKPPDTRGLSKSQKMFVSGC